MPLIQWIMQNLQPRAQDSALLGGTASISLEYQLPDTGQAGGAILGAETADFTAKKVFRKLIRFIPGDIAFDVCSKQKWTIQSYYFDLNGFTKYIAYNNLKYAEFFENELQVERSWIRKNYLQAKAKTEYLESLSQLEKAKEFFAPLSDSSNLAVFKFLPGDIVFDIYDRKKWRVSDYFIDLNSFTHYIVTDGLLQLEYLEDELQINKPSIRQNCSLTETKDEYTKIQEKISYLESHFSAGSVSLAHETNVAVLKFMPGETVFDVYKKQKWQIVDSFMDLNGKETYTVTNGVTRKKFLEEELQTERLAMEKLYEEAEKKLSLLQAPAALKKKGVKR